MSPRGTDSQFVNLLRPVMVWLTVQRWDGRKARESPHLRVTNTFFQKRQVWLFRIERVPAWSTWPKPAFGSDGGGGGEPSLFSDRNISQKCGPLRNADGFRNCWEHRPLKRRQRPLTRVFSGLQSTLTYLTAGHVWADRGGGEGDGHMTSAADVPAAAVQ